MECETQNVRHHRFRKWLNWNSKAPNPFDLVEVQDDDESEDDDHSDDGFVSPMEMESCILTNEFRVFVGTWNVAGRSPVDSLAVDLDDWFKIKEEADIYVIGEFLEEGITLLNNIYRLQEIVPLKTRTVIGTEDPTAATKWNTLIGKTLNNKSGCSCLTPIIHRNSDYDYHYEGIQGSERRNSVCRSPPTVMREMTNLQEEEANGGSSRYSTYRLMASKKMVGVFISVWMRKNLLKKYCVSNVKVCSVACGIMGYLGNKGSVSVSMSIEGTSFCFIAAHLASGEKKGNEVHRNYQVSEIFRRTSFPRRPQDDNNPHPLTILGHDRIFWFGDLNYRLYLEDSLARELIKKEDWRALQQFDQLRREQNEGGVFQGWREGNIEFAPTYKYSSLNSNRYSGGLPNKSGEKQRTPAWCDRILWYGKGVKQLSYLRSESKFSDHRPVSALFSIQIEVVKSMNPLIFTLPITHPIVPSSNQIELEAEEEEEEGSGQPTLLSLMVKDMEASPTRDATTIKSLASSLL